LSRTNFRHVTNPQHLEERAANLKKMYAFVCKDRASNALIAWNARRAKLKLDDLDVQDKSLGQNGGINFDELDSF
jgi:hypothetical protein